MQCTLLCVCLTPPLSPACSHLDSLLKYHRCYHISLSAFQDIYTTILSLQDELEQGMASENEEAALENLSQDWQVSRIVSESAEVSPSLLVLTALLLVWSSS